MLWQHQTGKEGGGKEEGDGRRPMQRHQLQVGKEREGKEELDEQTMLARW
jgi:hypothetical protein